MPFAPRPRRQADDPDDALGALLAPLSGVMDNGDARLGSALVGKGVELWTDPAKAVALAGQGTALTAEIAKLALMQQDSPTRFKGKPGVGKRVAWADPLPLAEVKAVGKALGASVNDVLLSCVAGAIAQLPGRQGSTHRRRDDPRAGAGEPAADGKGLQARQSVRAGVPRSADRHRQPGRASVRSARQHECAQGLVSAGAGVGPAGRDGLGAEGIAGDRCCRHSRAMRPA